ncbi:MAG TPA: type II secretion system protein [Candidatus Stercorousia faecigallinarum]|nr:type II secretion system protein [Candidatus Stercorousia faecigallinarum]
MPGQVARLAFTLAEVLVTLGIIGVVSAMTVPTLVQNHQRKTYTTSLHKVYNQISQALMQYQTDRNALNLAEAGLTNEDAVGGFFKTYFKVINDCGEDFSPCFASASEYKYLNGKALNPDKRGKHIVLADGTSIRYEYRSNLGLVLIELFVDINGVKGPNIAGRDIFALYIYKNGNIDDYSYDNTTAERLTKEQRERSFNTVCSGNTNGNWYGCFGKILNDNWEMNY